MRLDLGSLFRAITVAVVCASARAQVELNPPSRDASVISVDVDLVNVLCTVRDNRGAYVKGLGKDDFELREDGHRQSITNFAAQVDTPLTVAIMVDMSGSVMNIISTEKDAAARFLSNVLRPGDRALLVGFAERIVVWQDLTASHGLLEAALNRAGPYAPRSIGQLVTRPRGGTLLYDAINLVARKKLADLPGRKTIVVISDGLDNGSVAKLNTAVQAAQEADAVLYSIHYQGDSFSSGGGGALEHLAEPTGGRMFHVKQDTRLETVFDTIAEEMRNQYSLGYRLPGPKDGSFHKLEVKALRPGLKVQARNGYYAR